MDWSDIVREVRVIKENFEKSHKCLNTDRPTKNETVEKHLEILFTCLEEIRVILNENYSRLTTAHKSAADSFFTDIREKLVNVLERRGFQVDLPVSLHEEIKYNLKPTLQKEINFEDTKMTQTVVEFLNTASKLISDFDGKPENIRSFIDSLSLVNSIKGEHESVAISLIKTKLKGNARNLINNESSITEIINKLTSSVKGESVEVISAKIMNIRQNNKSANTYCNEVEALTKSLESAYISDGLSCELATKYSTRVAVKALTKNCTIDKVKLIMEAGQFNNMNDAVEKFVNSCTESTGQQNTILYSNQRSPNNRYSRGNFRGRYRGRGGQMNNNNRDNQATNYNHRRRGRNYGRNNRENGHRVRVANNQDDNSENSNTPLRSNH